MFGGVYFPRGHTVKYNWTDWHQSDQPCLNIINYLFPGVITSQDFTVLENVFNDMDVSHMANFSEMSYNWHIPQRPKFGVFEQLII